MNKDAIKKSVVEVLQQFDIKKAGFFGSIVNGTFSEESDIDIIIEFNDRNNKSLLDLIELKNVLEEKTSFKIDLITYDSVNPALKDYILKNNEIIYG